MINFSWKWQLKLTDFTKRKSADDSVRWCGTEDIQLKNPDQLTERRSGLGKHLSMKIRSWLSETVVKQKSDRYLSPCRLATDLIRFFNFTETWPFLCKVGWSQSHENYSPSYWRLCRILLLHGFLPWDGLFWMEISPPCKWMNNSNHKLDLPLQGFSSAKNMFHEFHGILVVMRNRILARGQIGIKTS